ncbi:MAG: hypothetical protein Q4F17_09145 [Eubacteriales bacterium]|nr:hypothetical protein [Eubacteriales bacterium]
MKRFICYALLLCMFFSLIPVTANAAEVSDKNEEVIYFEDGSFLMVSVRTRNTRSSGSVSADKVYTFDTGSGVKWEAVLSGSFTYTGSSATCTSSSVSVDIYDSAWYTVSKSAGKSGASATGSVTMGRKAGGITVDKVPLSLKLTCDANGNLS